MGDILTGIVKGLSGFMLQDDPDVKIFNAQTEMKEFSEREGKIYARLGRQVYETDGGENYPEIRAELDLHAANKQAAESRPRTCRGRGTCPPGSRGAEHSCPNCGAYNPEGTNFCQECGTRLTQPVQQAPAAKRFCPNCGTEVIAGHRFCSGCGTKME